MLNGDRGEAQKMESPFPHAPCLGVEVDPLTRWNHVPRGMSIVATPEDQAPFPRRGRRIEEGECHCLSALRFAKHVAAAIGDGEEVAWLL